MHGGLELARPRRRSKLLRVAAVLLLAAGAWLGLPYLQAAAPAVIAHCRDTVGDWVRPGYTARLEALQQENADLHQRLARSEAAAAENDAMRQLLGSPLPEGCWQSGRVVARRGDGAVLACRAERGAPVVDAQGRYAGQVVEAETNGSCFFAFAGSAEAPCAGLCGTAAGLLERRGDWVLTGLPADCTLAASSVVTTPDGCWLGTLAEDPRPDRDGLTARAALTDTAALDSTVFFVKIG